MHKPDIELSKRILRPASMVPKTQMCRALLYRKMNPNDRLYDETFPLPVKLSARAVGWFESEVDEWLESRRVKLRRRLEITNL